ncbi:glycosyltransferase family 2 protein [Kangiella taiwanensis]|uniref:Glycosyltransferase 2-like domain-containing protein n=1 Tax=Kangiella taiwanensis TaxID=1079179 RepID=A0ABP8I0J5_9GAMM|nr:glycosyltransferase [Kangiella taiwanensis]
MKNKPLITVYIVNHNYGKYIEQAIESTVNQSYPNIEILIIDDGSTDNSREILTKYIGQEKIEVIFQENKGLTKTNNTALRLAEGEYIVRLDADDTFKPNALQNLLDGFTDKDVAMVFGNWDVVDESGNHLYTFKRHDFENDVTLLDCPAHGACTMFYTKYLKAVGGYDEELQCQDGFELWFRVVDNFKVKSLDKLIFNYRRHGSNLTGNEEKILYTRSNILRKVAEKKGSVDSSFVVIPIRGGSLDSRSNPFEKINGKFLIDLIVEDLLNYNLFEKIIITTPDKSLREYILSNYENIIVHARGVDISLINSKLDAVVQDVYETYNELGSFEYGVILGLDRPFNKKYLIQSALDIASIFDVDNVIGVRPSDDFYFTHNGQSLYGINFDKTSVRLERDEIYQMVNGFLVFKCEKLSKDGEIWGETIGHVVFDQISAHSISSRLDLDIAELYSNKLEERKTK